MTAAANTTTATAAAISPQGRCGATTLAAGRVRPPFAAGPPLPAGLPGPVAGLRSLAKASPRCWVQMVGAPVAPVGSVDPRARAILGRPPVRSLGACETWDEAGRRGSGGRS